MSKTGQLEVLSVGKGHLRLTVTTTSKKDREEARKTIEDMLRRGYAIFVELEPGKPLERVKRFDPKRMEYIIAEMGEPVPAAAGVTSGPKRRPRRIAAGRAQATVVGRTAGG